MSEDIYPKILVTEDEITEYNNNPMDGRKKTNSARINEINAKKAELKKLYDRYKKSKKQWSSAEIGIFIGRIIVTGIAGGSVAAFHPILGAAIIVGAVSGIACSIIEIISYVGIHQLIKKKTQFYKQRCIIIKCYIDRLYLLFNKIAEDGVTTNVEYESYMKLMKEFEDEFNKPQAESDKFIESYKSKMQPKFDKRAKQEVKKELKQQYIFNAVSQAKEKMMK
jgi:hypothetical protein